jgi:hypothetical protein
MPARTLSSKATPGESTVSAGCSFRPPGHSSVPMNPFCSDCLNALRNAGHRKENSSEIEESEPWELDAAKRINRLLDFTRTVDLRTTEKSDPIRARGLSTANCA